MTAAIRAGQPLGCERTHDRFHVAAATGNKDDDIFHSPALYLVHRHRATQRQDIVAMQQARRPWQPRASWRTAMTGYSNE
jgi:hypothetical protein